MKTHREDFTLPSPHDGLLLGVTLIEPQPTLATKIKTKLSTLTGHTAHDAPPRAVIQLVHGMAEHRLRYTDFMTYCAAHGYATIIHDHRGHGDSIRSVQDYGYFYQDGMQGILTDVAAINRYAHDRYPGLPLILLGHSMGSLIVRCYMQDHDNTIDGLIVCGPPASNALAGVGVGLAKLIGALRGQHYRSRFLDHLTFPHYNQKFPGEPSRAWVVSDPAIQKAHAADKQSGFTFTANGFAVLFKLVQQAYRRTGWQLQNPTAPIFFIAGADDPVIKGSERFTRTVDFMRARGYQNVTSKLYPHLRHEILNEISKEAVWTDILTWAEANVLKQR